MRSRSRSETGPTVITKAEGYSASGSCANPFLWTRNTALDINGSYVESSKVETFDDVVVVGFERRRDHGEIFMNPMNRVITEIRREPVLYDEMYSTWRTLTCGTSPNLYYPTAYYTGSHIYGTGSPTTFLPYESYPTTPTLDPVTVRELATTAAYANANESELLILEPIAESKETIHSLLKMAGRIIRLIAKVRKSAWKAVWKEFTPKQLSDRWMEGRYMIRPLIYDIAALMRVIENHSKPKRQRQTYRGSNSSSASNESVIKTFTRSGGYEIYSKYRTERTVSARAGVLCQVEEVEYISKLGLDQPVSTLWELVPCSFVVDWFCNLGKVIGSWEPKLGITGLASWVTVSDAVVKTKVIDHVNDLYVRVPSTYERYVNISGGKCTTTTTTITRLPNPNKPITPHIKVRLDLAKLLDLVIMIRQRLA